MPLGLLGSVREGGGEEGLADGRAEELCCGTEDDMPSTPPAFPCHLLLPQQNESNQQGGRPVGRSSRREPVRWYLSGNWFHRHLQE